MNRDTLLKPTQYTENKLLIAILDGEYPPGSKLPAERALAEKIGVTRPTLRETLQRMAREGWLTIAHGKPTIVNDYIADGGMGLLSTLSKYGEYLSEGFVGYFLEVRAVLMPAIAARACQRDPSVICDYLEKANAIEDNAKMYTIYDWSLQMLFADCSGNPIFKMMLNDFTDMFDVLGVYYFSHAKARKASLAYYKRLLYCLQSGNPAEAETIVSEAMRVSEAFWSELEDTNRLLTGK